MENFKFLSDDAIRNINGGFLKLDLGDDVLYGYPGSGLVNFIWSTLKGAYQKGYDDKLLNVEPCR